MYMCVNKSWCDSQTGEIENSFFILRGKVQTKFGNDSILNPDIHNCVGFCSGIDKMTIF